MEVSSCALAKSCGMPVLPVALSRIMYAEPRVLKAGGCTNEVANATNSIVAGCAFANHQARAYLHEALQRYHEAYIAVPVGQLVDDTPTSFLSQRPETLQASLIQVG